MRTPDAMVCGKGSNPISVNSNTSHTVLPSEVNLFLQ